MTYIGISSRHLRRRQLAIASGALALAAVLALPAAAQESLAARVAALKNGSAQFEFPSREDACGDGQRFIRIGDSMNGYFDSNTDTSNCEPGPVRIVLEVRDGRVASLRDYLGPVSPAAPGVRELGEVSAAEGSGFLLGLVIILLVLGVMALLGRRRQKAAQAKARAGRGG